MQTDRNLDFWKFPWSSVKVSHHPLNLELSLKQWGHQPNCIFSIQYCELFAFFFFPAPQQLSPVHTEPLGLSSTPTPCFMHQDFLCPSFLLLQLPPNKFKHTHRHPAFAVSFHPTGTPGSLFWYQGNETLLAKKGFL